MTTSFNVLFEKIMRISNSLSLFLFLFCAVIDLTAQTQDSLSRSQMFELSLAESRNKIEADFFNHTKILYDTLGYDSIVQKYYPSGQLYKQCNYLNGLLHGKAVTFHSNGRLGNEKHYCLGECTDSQYIYYDMFGFVELESWKISYRGRDFSCATRYGYGKLSTVRIYDCRNPQVEYAGFMWKNGEWKPYNPHHLNAPDANRVLKRYKKEYARRHLNDRN